ncbi:glycine oxidase ThiO [Corynebacterium epidermidicanis]|uniref:glycine oxidase n=1 Tax=Corynebacterium epidermidicanis TaxID=1050174 RepID=A0A0G3GZP3_9CORY|nr:glycine oxidase ThiO [Corynebacterium epidermidicanis]AKK04302.1 glycine oxidase [Corynebacterium epidermidicanis]
MLDVAIVGGGIIGLSTAWVLLKRGYNVQVFDPDPASQASFAAAGMLAPVSEVVWDQPGLYPLMRRSRELFPDFAAAVAEESGMDVGYLPSETLVCAGDNADRVYLRELIELQSSIGEVTLLSAREARALEPGLGPGVVGAVHIPGDHQVDPRKFCAALLRILDDRVVRAKVVDAKQGAITLDDGTVVTADKVVLANGLAATDFVDLPLRPVHGDVLRLRVPKHAMPLVSRTVRAVVRGRPVYVVPRSDNQIVLGATSREDSLWGVSAEGVHQLLRDAHHIVPGIWECEIEEMTARARPGSPDDIPFIGEVSPGLIVSTGYFRHGILLSAIGAELTADVVCEKPLPTDFAEAVDVFRYGME